MQVSSEKFSAGGASNRIDVNVINSTSAESVSSTSSARGTKTAPCNISGSPAGATPALPNFLISYEKVTAPMFGVRER